MPTLVTLRPPTDAERRAMDRLAHSRIGPGRVVERAQIVGRAHRGERGPALARALGVSDATVRLWLKRFNAGGVDGLADAPRSGRPPVDTPDEVGAVIAARLTKPDDLDRPFGSWTLDRLTAYLQDTKQLGIGRTRVGEILRAEGRRWRPQATWFGGRVDPAFVQKRGRSSRCTPSRPPAAS